MLKLYKIKGIDKSRTGTMFEKETEYIIAKKPSEAIKKFAEMHPDCNKIKAVSLCSKENIIEA